MNPLDELLSATAQVDDIAPAALLDGHAALKAAIAGRSQPQSSAAEPLRRQVQPPRRTKRTMLIAACLAAAAAVAAGTTLTLFPGHSEGSRPSGLQPVGGATSGAGINLTAAVVLRDAGQVAGEQQGGWPNAAYWQVTSVYERDGKTYHRQVWIAHRASSVIEDDGVFGTMAPNLDTGTFLVGTASLTWDQVYALPTDPAKLRAALMSDIASTGSGAAADLYTAVGDLLRESPAPPALREALYEVAADIPGVKLLGKYKDALGRTGTAVERDGETLLIDPDTGQLLADTEGNPKSAVACGNGCTEYGVAYTYASQGPVTSAPALP